MKLYTQFVGGIGDILTQMMKPGSHLGYFPALKARGDETMVKVHANTDAALALFERLPYVDHVHFRAKTLRLNGPTDYQILKTWDGLPWLPPQLTLDAEEQRILDQVMGEPYIAVHIFASQLNKALPERPEQLLAGLAGQRVVLLGIETSDDGPTVIGNRVGGIKMKLTTLGIPCITLPPKLRLHVAVAQHASKYIGTLSCFNCAAQLARVPSFVLVNRSVKDPGIYKLMADNRAHAEAWNIEGGTTLDEIYRRVVWWASQ